MPIYDYRCAECGPFTAMQPMTRYREPCDCPACDAPATRTLLGAPALAIGDIDQRTSVEREGNSDPVPRKAHPAGCGCCVRRAPIPGKLVSKGRVFASNGPLPRRER